MSEVEGYVWCDKHGEVHGDTLNPMGYTSDPRNDFCKPEDHFKIYRVPSGDAGDPKIITDLREAAEQCSKWNHNLDIPPYSMWSMLMDDAAAEIARWFGECDKVGIPYDPEILVRHHRANAQLVGRLEADAAWRREVEATHKRDEQLGRRS